MTIDYAKISINELERIYFLHSDNYDFVFDGDKKQVILVKKDSEE